MPAAEVPGAGPAVRVLHVGHTAEAGGAELALVRLLAGEHPWTATVCAPPGGTAFDPLPALGIAMDRRLPALPGGGTSTRDPVRVARYLAGLGAGARALRRGPLRDGVDLIHANTAAAAIMCALADRRRRFPLVVHLRDLVTVESLGRFGHAALTRVGLRRADAVIANSHATLRSAEGWLAGPGPRAVLPSPLGIAELGAGPTVRPQVRVVGMLGRLQWWKGQHVFLRAFAQAFGGTAVRAQLAGAPLFGTAGYAEQLHRLAAELGIAGQVSFLGHVTDLASFFDQVDIVVHASIRPEPLGQSVLQALAYGKPVIATAGGGPDEWITSGHNGLLVEADRPEALAAALASLAGSHRLRQALATAGPATGGIRTDGQCAAEHGDFFTEVWRRHRATTAGGAP